MSNEDAPASASASLSPTSRKKKSRVLFCCCGVVPNGDGEDYEVDGSDGEDQQPQLSEKLGIIDLGDRFKSVVGGNDAVVFKDVPRLVHCSCVYVGVPRSLSDNRHSDSVFDGPSLNHAIAEGTNDDMKRRRALLSVLVHALQQLVDGAETVKEIEPIDDYDLLAEFSADGKRRDGAVWPILQAVNQAVIMPAIASMHRRLTEADITQLPLLDSRRPDAWMVDIFVERHPLAPPSPKTPQAQDESVESKLLDGDDTADGGEEAHSPREEVTSPAASGMHPRVIVRHKRWMRSSDPTWPFQGFWHLDSKYTLNGGKLECTQAEATVVALELQTQGMSPDVARQKVTRLRNCLGPPDNMDGIEWIDDKGWKLAGME